MPVFRLDERDMSFPPPHLSERSGLLAIGGDLRPERLITAYQYGIFPWFEDQGHFFWYCPDPRCVLWPDELRVHKSMRSIFNQGKFTYTMDTQFETVMRACSGHFRPGQGSSWISEDFIQGYTRLHKMGLAHSVEVWQDDTLAGGLYGVSLGKVFFGESMFSNVPNASKAGFIRLVHALQNAGYKMIDCQQETGHLVSLGAKTIQRDLFLEYLAQNRYERTQAAYWSFGVEGELALREVPKEG
jgi:leucyl/phenylalanyl-tRNA---protein transferase